MPRPHATAGEPRQTWWSTAAVGLLVFSTALVVFSAHRRDDEPRFMDESAFLSQSFYWDLLASGRRDDPRWLDYPAYDLPPLPKYLIGASLQAHGLPRPDWTRYLAWYRRPGEDGFVTLASLRAARLPSLILGASGCAALFAIGCLGGDRRIGLLSALLLIANPLYRLHARRAMADVPAECLILTAEALGLLLWTGLARDRRFGARDAMLVVLSGLTCGLAVLAKLNGGLGLMTVLAWLAPLAMVPRTRAVAWPSMIGIATIAMVTFVALNPFITARPATLGGLPLMAPKPRDQTIFERLFAVVAHRVDVSRGGQKGFPRDALTTLPEKFAALSAQGFGRFGPFGPSHSDSTKRFDLPQDRGAFAWLPAVVFGLVVSVASGRRRLREGLAPGPWAFVLQFWLAIATVGAFLPLAWDRYFLSIQPGSCLMASVGLVWLFDAMRSRGRPA